MGKNAIVTGGTRGIGAAISKRLKGNGYTVAATYAGNDEAAAKFKEETGIDVYKWDVGDYESCKGGVTLQGDTIYPSLQSIRLIAHMSHNVVSVPLAFCSKPFQNLKNEPNGALSIYINALAFILK